MSTRSCFVIGAIGAADSDVRVSADWLLDHVIRPVLEGDPFKYAVTRADQVSEPGMISGQVIMAAINSDLVIADLTGFNPNAFYELGIRHLMGKPVIHMMEDDGTTRIPFDVADYRTIMFKTRTVVDYQNIRLQLEKQVKAIEDDKHEVSNPVTRARGSQKINESSDPRDKLMAELSQRVSGIETQLRTLREEAVTTFADWGGQMAHRRQVGALSSMATAGNPGLFATGMRYVEPYADTPLSLRESAATDVSAGSNVMKKG